MTKGHKKHGGHGPHTLRGLPPLKKLKKIPGLLNQKYDSLIMAEILAIPEIKNAIEELNLNNDVGLPYVKGYVVKNGLYSYMVDYWAKERGKKEMR
jgi:hypothetical protein